MRTRLSVAAAVATGSWLVAFGGFAVYVNWFSETDRNGGRLVLALAWLALAAAVVTTCALVVRLASDAWQGSRR
jgi:uncharacterized BrkB/YihY/UPF0761 family membrane protein